MNRHHSSTLLLIISDWIGAVIAWTIFYGYRKVSEVGVSSLQSAFSDHRFCLALIIIPIVWLLLFYLIGSYRHTLFKTRLGGIEEALLVSVVGSIGLLLLVISDDVLSLEGGYVRSFMVVLIIHAALFGVLRVVTMQIIKSCIKNGRWAYKTVIIGQERAILGSSFQIIHQKESIDKYISRPSDADVVVINDADKSSLIEDLPNLIGTFQGHVVLIHESLMEALDHDYDAIPYIRMPYLKVFCDPLSSWQSTIKRIGDVLASVLAMLLLSPLFIWIYFKVRSSSSGDVIFSQERIGQHGRPFNIYKFRSMWEGAEQEGPALASCEDDRCTPFGAWMRRWRLDELPQFLNVIRGDMSIVGPRPERRFYADQLILRESSYPLLWRVRPGITSWGQIRYGYAASIDEMLKRYRYDALYMERMGPLMDLRILWYTIIVLIQGKGR